MSIVKKAAAMLKEDGAAYIAHKVKKKLQRKLGVKKALYSEKELQQQRETDFSREITFSILVPLYNTP